MAESETDAADGLTKIEFIREYFQEVVGKPIPDPKPIQATPVPAPVPVPVPAPAPAPSPSTPPQGSVTTEAQLETLTSIRFINPEPGATVTSPFGFRRHPISGGNRRHNGVDLAKGKGTPMLAVAAGKVVDIGSWGGYGEQSITIYHGKVNGKIVSTMYGHGDTLVKKGDFVRQGQTIGRENTRGQSTGSHLHLGCTIGWNWATQGYCPNNNSAWVDAVKNFMNRAYDGIVAIITDGQLDNGIKGGTTLPD